MADDRLRRAERAWWASGDLGDLEEFAHMWNRSNGGDLFHFRAIASGLFDYLGSNKWGTSEYLHKDTGMVLVRVEPGDMEESRNGIGGIATRSTHFSRAFLVGKHMVSQKEWLSVMVGNPSRRRATLGEPLDISGNLIENLPVENMRYEQCLAFCRQTNTRLLTEAMWIYMYEGSHPKIRSTTAGPNWTRFPGGKNTPNPAGICPGKLFQWTADEWHLDPIDRPVNGLEAWVRAKDHSYNDPLWLRGSVLELTHSGIGHPEPPPKELEIEHRVSLAEQRITNYGVSAPIQKTYAATEARTLNSDGQEVVIRARDESDPTGSRAELDLFGATSPRTKSSSARSTLSSRPLEEGARTQPTGRSPGVSAYAGADLPEEIRNMPRDEGAVSVYLDDIDVASVVEDVSGRSTQRISDHVRRGQVVKMSTGRRIGSRQRPTIGLRVCWG